MEFKSLLKDLGESWVSTIKGMAVWQDMLAAFTVAAVALPLNIALAIACGLPAEAGLLAGAIGGGIAAIFGGSPLQVTGPSTALNVAVLALYGDFGLVGVAGSCLIIGFIQIGLSLGKCGRFVQYVPEAILAGFTTGVGLKLLDQQIPEFLGFGYSVFELAEMIHRPQWLHEVSWLAVVNGLFMALLVISCKSFKKFPAALLGIILVTYVSNHLGWDIKRVGVLQGFLPSPQIPDLAMERWVQLFLASLPLALLASIESLLSAQVVDKLSSAKKSYSSNLELLGQGLANAGSGLVGGMPVSGAIVRSTVNVQSGARTRLSSLLHAAILLASTYYLNDMLATVPLSALAGLLCVVGVRLVDVPFLRELIKEKKVEAVCFCIAAFGTVSGHLMLGLAVSSCVHTLNLWIFREKKIDTEKMKVSKDPSGIRARIPARELVLRKVNHYEISTGGTNWLNQIREKAHLAASSFVHHRASLIGRVVLGEHVHIAAESSVRADEGSPFYIGANSNIQDGVVIHALKEKWVNVGGEDWAVYIGQNVSVAHQALVHGPCYIGDNSFIGFQAIVHDSVVGRHCYIGIGAIVVGVEIPDERYVPHGAVIDKLEKVEALARVSDAHTHFNEDVVGVNKGLAAAYRKHQKGEQTRRGDSSRYVPFRGSASLSFDRF
ncbi:MAG: hypothetical protein KA436_02480 [Oligoflexales bacterium]|nr:hypothetical protein [Oligoflexales bacterium]